MTESLNLLWAELMVEELVRSGCGYFCVCPGSRSTPLAMAVARNRQTRSVICFDERGAAFHALGYCRGSARPAAVITTSGSAAANLLPAVTEASNDHVPLIVITADRPPELHDTGANQTMSQTRLFDPFIRWRFDLPCPTSEIQPSFVLTTVDQAVHRALHDNPGPVHLNCMYREPFFAPPLPESYDKNLAKWRSSAAPYTSYDAPVRTVNDAAMNEIASLVSQAKRGMLFIGGLSTLPEREAVLALIQKLGWPVYADITSGLRLTTCGTHLMRYIDGELQGKEFNDKIRADVVLHLGGRIVSKRVGLFFAQHRPDHFIVVKDTPERLDAVHAVTRHAQCSVAWFASALAQRIKPTPLTPYARWCNDAAGTIDGIVARTVMQDDTLSEVYAARRTTELVPEGATLVVSSSMPVRDVDIYGVTGRAGVNAVVNRGVSGIDGVIATASGVAEGTNAPVVLLIGDLAAIHDINSLSILRECRHPVVTVIINNQGGGIFHFLPVAKHTDVFERYFRTPHDFTFKGAGELFKIAYCNPDTKVSFDAALRCALDSGTHAIIEVRTDSEAALHLRKTMKKEILDMFERKMRE